MLLDLYQGEILAATSQALRVLSSLCVSLCGARPACSAPPSAECRQSWPHSATRRIIVVIKQLLHLYNHFIIHLFKSLFCLILLSDWYFPNDQWLWSISNFQLRHRSTIQMSQDKEQEVMLPSLIKCQNYTSGESATMCILVLLLGVQKM